MYRNQYDTDSITWSPQGRLFQVEYAMEAVKQGTCCVGAKSDTHVVNIFTFRFYVHFAVELQNWLHIMKKCLKLTITLELLCLE